MPRYLIGRSNEIMHLEDGAGIAFERYGETLRILGTSLGVSLVSLLQDLGVAQRSGFFDITGLSGLTADAPVLVQHTAGVVPSKGFARDEPEMDLVRAIGYVLNATTIRVYWHAPSVVVGDVAFAYAVAT